ncbi:hypothetical protein [Polymorphospora rubra]|uniref:RecT family protein n=1 Tax=Polymorphospora rubra TaxID=338584 RepID=A0A810MVV5_9ACTN|nr:hypothetical protein [Polymorphospora rubra]BCJ64119.1 hypothetical protein Prubr_11400 [Polymorphospora rubra]
MTELAVRPATNGWGVVDHIQQPAPGPARQDLAEWVAQAREVANIADMLCRTSFVPKAFQGKAAECAAAILAGQEMDMSPMASLRAIDVIEGKPGLTALGLRALVQSKGHEIWVHESTATRAIVKGRRRGSDKVESSTWTMDRAKHLAGKDNWRKQPTAMLLARATAECARLIAADALLGMPYSTEELADGADVPVSAVPDTTEAKPTTARRTARRAQPKAEPAPVPEPSLEDPEQVPATVAAIDDAVAAGASAPWQPGEREEMTADSEPGITDAQITKLHTSFSKQGIKDRDAKSAFIEQVTGRRVGSSKELSRREAMRVIDALEAPAVEEPPYDDEPGFDDDWPTVPVIGGGQ